MGDIDGFLQLILGLYKSDKPIKMTGFRKSFLNCDCINGNIKDGIREQILYSFTLDKPPGQKSSKEPIFKLFKKVSESVLTDITFYLEDDVEETVDLKKR